MPMAQIPSCLSVCKANLHIGFLGCVVFWGQQLLSLLLGSSNALDGCIPFTLCQFQRQVADATSRSSVQMTPLALRLLPLQFSRCFFEPQEKCLRFSHVPGHQAPFYLDSTPQAGLARVRPKFRQVQQRQVVCRWYLSVSKQNCFLWLWCPIRNLYPTFSTLSIGA